MPGVAEASGASNRCRAAPPNPDRRMRLPPGRGRRVYVLEACGAGVGRDRWLRPVARQDCQIVVADPTPPFELDAERLEFGARPAHADAEDEPSTAELVEIGGHAGQQQRMAVRQDHDGRAELDSRGTPG